MNEKNEIIDEIRQARIEIAKDNENDIEKIFQSYRKRQANNPKEYFTGTPVKIRKSKAA
jgi:hypothetical protein